MSLLVFGRTGQVARELARLAPEGMVQLGRDAADLGIPGACDAAIRRQRPSVVINAASYTNVNRAEAEEALARRINAAAPGEMARACADLGVPFLHVSTDYVFDGSGTLPRTEADPVAPLNAYGRSKLAGEQAVAAAGGRHAILRTSWVFSAHGTNFVRTMLALSETRDTLSVVDDEVGGPTAAGDIAAALLRMARMMQGGEGGQGVYHFAGTPAVSWKTFACESLGRAGRKTVVNGISSRDWAAMQKPPYARRPLNSRLDCTRILKDFGIGAPDWRSALDRVLQDIQVA
jgi:dTDP-4-dehydrorhamnose reductase